ncbi:hypothetical protein HPB50_004289 [Hyalomma asiaticum]|uniref:Uncharacterized protein n=1 Tax=Hyalomma asiaticum TaxID=266040 RepID=A0ACB7T8S4_HYAAI|nr:hypothetical protein HPB50_004289 [Hyalomma asiaticum]
MSSPSSESESCSVSSTESDDAAQVGIAAIADVLNHFQFDPLQSSESDDDENSEGNDGGGNQRTGHAEWCSCGRCVPMNTEHESVCCREVERANAFIAAGTDCITLHPTFNRVCLDVHVVEVAYYWLMEDRPSQVDDPEIHRRYRYTAYRQFTRWIWHRLGR